MIVALILAVIVIAIAVWAFSNGDAATTGADEPAQTTVAEPAETTAPTETTAPADTTTVAP